MKKLLTVVAMLSAVRALFSLVPMVWGDSPSDQAYPPFEDSIFEPMFDPSGEQSIAQGEPGTILFDQVVQRFDEIYPSFSYKGVDWAALQTRFRPRFADPMGPEAFAHELVAMLSELRDMHAQVRLPNGQYLEVYSPGWERNFTSEPRNRYSWGGYRTLGSNVIWHTWMPGTVAYIRIDTLDTATFAGVDEAAIESLFATYAGATGMIVDLRPNSGGNEDIATMFASRFTDTERIYGYVRYRSGPGHDDLGEPLSKSLVPSVGARFLGPTAVLVGNRNMSSAEWFVLMMDACPNVTLIGAQTRGSSGNPEWITLANGVSVGIPRWLALRPDMTPLEDNGVAPDIEIPASSSFDGAHDYVVERALAVLAEN